MPRAPLTIPIDDGPVAPWVDRTVAFVVVGIAATVVTALARVTPDARGHGTHEQLGMSACSFPTNYGIPCPTCGCTTAACLVVHGRFVTAFVVQPFGALLTIALLLLAVHALVCLFGRRSFVDLTVRLPVWRLFASALVVMLLAWWYKYLVFAG
jgi:hypothetical protein